MTAVLHVRTGSQAGQRLVLETATATVGRDPDSTLRFDPEGERAVSAKHATVELVGGRWRVRDTASLNGTYVNGRPIKNVKLSDGDRIRFGVDGPEVEFSWPEDPGHRTGLARYRRAPLAVISGLFLVALGGTSLAVHEASHRRELSRVRERADSVLAASEQAVAALDGRIGGLTSALHESQETALALRTRLEMAEGQEDAARVEQLESELQDATAELTRLRNLASLDFERIRAANEGAVAVLYAEFEPGRTTSATAFAVKKDGTLITNRHVVLGESGQRPSRIAVQFARSDQTFRARLITFARDLDLAVVKVDDVLGDVPTIAGIAAEPPRPGDGVAVIGFPLGGSATPQGGAEVPRPVLSAGIVTRVDDVRLEFDGYGAAGASGSPVFRDDGMLIGVLYGGVDRGDRGNILAVPATFVDELLELIESGQSSESN